MFKKSKPEPKLNTYSRPFAKHFKGFKRFPVVQHGIGDAEANCKYLSDNGIQSDTVIFVEKMSRNNELYIEVYVDNRQIGSIFDSEQIKAVQSEAFSDVHVRFETQTIVGKRSSEEREHALVFVKYKE